MRRTAAVAVLVVVAGSSVALAQPAATPRASLFTPREQEILAQGEISGGRWAGSGLLAISLGYGTGHAAQWRFREDGWKFALLDGVATTVFAIGVIDCAADAVDTEEDRDCRDGMIYLGILAKLVSNIWQTVDVLHYPSGYNRHVRHLRDRAGYGPPPPRYGFYVRPIGAHGGAAGLTLRF